MTEGYEMVSQAIKNIDLDIYVMDLQQYETIKSIALGMGYNRSS